VVAFEFVDGAQLSDIPVVFALLDPEFEVLFPEYV
jgi:hypothetical protein